MENICRICLGNSKDLANLYSNYFDIECKVNLYEVFVECTTIQLESEEISVVCLDCMNLLLSAYNLRLKAKESTEFLRSTKVEAIVKEEDQLLKTQFKWDSPDENYFLEHDDEFYGTRNGTTVNNSIINQKEELTKVPNGDSKKGKRKSGSKPKDIRKLTKKQSIETKTHWDYRCRYCLQYFKRIPNRFKCERNHMRQHGGIECHFCEKKMKDRSQMASHIFIHMFDPSRFKCQHCDKTFTAQASLWKHVTDMHPTDPSKSKSFVCNICGKQFIHKNNFNGHMIRHQGVSGRCRICDLCGKRFITVHEIRRHIETVHLSLKKYQCDLCGKSFKRGLNLRIHNESTHSDGKKFKCNICGKMLKSSMSLYSHMIIHNGTYKFSCTFPGCEATFKHKTAVKSHMRVHEPSITLSCPHCPKQFRFNASLRCHVKKHLGELFYCDMCERGYATKADLKEHQEVVHGGKRYQCTACGCGLTSKNNLRRHVNQHCTAGVKKPI